MSAPWSALIIDDDPGIRQSLRLCLEASDARVQHFATLAGGLDALERSRFDVVFLDLWLGSVSGLEALPEILRCQPGLGIIVITAFASYETAVEAMRLGAVDYLPKPFTPEQVRSAARRVVEASILKRQVRELQGRLDEAEGELTFETNSPSYATFLETLARAADSEAVVMLRGESGTGKTALARWVHRHSGRSQGPFVTVHCPLLSNDLMSSVLFGHCVGAFTGAVSDTVGKVEEATGGSLFLDEIGDLTADAQTRLLRFLHDRSYERVGDPRERCADVRLITATNRALETDVQAGRFREDLLFRLNVITLTVPPLRERVEDILPLARHYLDFFERRQGRRNLAFSPACEAAIQQHAWSGNLRELRNAVERAVILCPSSVMEAADLGLAVASAGDPGGVTVPETALGADIPLEQLEREHIARVLARATSFETAARTLGIDVTTLQRKRKRYGLA